MFDLSTCDYIYICNDNEILQYKQITLYICNDICNSTFYPSNNVHYAFLVNNLPKPGSGGSRI